MHAATNQCLQLTSEGALKWGTADYETGKPGACGETRNMDAVKAGCNDRSPSRRLNSTIEFPVLRMPHGPVFDSPSPTSILLIIRRIRMPRCAAIRHHHFECVTRLAAAACLVALPVILFAKQEPSVANEDRAGSQAPPEEVIDEVTVVAPRTARAIRSDIIRVEKVMYDIFNSLNTDPDYRVSCHWENRDTGNPTTIGKIKEWRCRTAYHSDILAEAFGGAAGPDATQNAMEASGSFAGPIRRHHEALKQYMAEIS
jgi:hypothetical protein